MIRIGKPEVSASSAPLQQNSPWESSLEKAGRLENEVGKWIERNPVLSIGIALAIGIGMGLLLKRHK